jgi:hypothetical protein
MELEFSFHLTLIWFSYFLDLILVLLIVKVFLTILLIKLSFQLHSSIFYIILLIASLNILTHFILYQI